MAQAFGVVHVFVSRETTENGLPQHSDKSMPAILAGSPVRQRFPCHRAEAKRVVEFAIGEQASVGGHDRTAKLEHQSAVEIEPESLVVRFTRRVRHDWSRESQISY